MSTRVGAPPAFAVARISGVRARGRLVSVVPASRASPFTAGVTYSPPSRAHAPLPCDSSPVGFLARTLRDVPAPPRALDVSPRSSRSESLCPGLSRFARSTACFTASRSPLERARLIAATAFFTRRCRHPIARTVSAPAAPRRTDEKKMPSLSRELASESARRPDASGGEEDGGRRFRAVEFDERDVACMTTRAATPPSGRYHGTSRADPVAGSVPLRASREARRRKHSHPLLSVSNAFALRSCARLALSGAGRTTPCPS